MRVSYSHKFVLLHVPRTGGSSVIRALDDQLFLRAPETSMNKLRSKYLWMLPRSIEQTTFRPHERALHVRRLLTPDVFDSFTRIAFVRNPYSWLVSIYERVMHSPTHRHYRTLSALGDFAAYIDWEIRRRKRHLHPYLLDRDGNMLVNRIGYFERLTEDATKLFAALGVDFAPLPHVGRFTPRDYREYYDARTIEKVAEHWARDLELFGYEFDGMRPDTRPPVAG